MLSVPACVQPCGFLVCACARARVCLLGIHSEPSYWLALDTWNDRRISTGLPDLVPLNSKCCSSSRNLSHVGHVQLGLQAKPEGN